MAAIGFVTYPEWSGAVLGKSSKPVAVTNSEARLVTLSVTGMTCSGCATNVKNALLATPGVSKVEVSFDEKKATVALDQKANATKGDLVKSVESIGYGAN